MTHLLCSAPAGLFLCLPLMSIMDIGYASPPFFHSIRDFTCKYGIYTI